MSRVAIIGAGAWGTALSIALGRKGTHCIRLWAHEKEVQTSISSRRVNEIFLPGETLPESVSVTGDFAQALHDAEIVVSVMPSQHCRQVFQQMRAWVTPEMLFVSATKGLEEQTVLRMTEVICSVLAPNGWRPRIGALSGPSFAKEVARGDPTAITIASADAELMETVQREFSDPRFRVYTNDDVTGVELGGALKNTIAIAAGICDGLGLGHNSVAALITRGLAEITRLVVACGGRHETMAGLAGLGDLVLTCTGGLSRNRSVGVELGRGRKLPEIIASMHGMVAEGVFTTHAALELARTHKIEMPITAQMDAILNQGKSPREAIQELMTRSAKSETGLYQIGVLVPVAAQHERHTADSTARLAGILRENQCGRAVGVYSICSANRFVLEAGMLQAQRDDSLVLIESTSNQVNQFGGYTGQTPAEFVSFVKGIAAGMNFPAGRIVFGGDHLGPHVWRKEAPSSAMEKAIELVRACVLAGYTKIHLDTSMRLAGDPGDSSGPLAEEIISNRAADLCRAAEDAYQRLPPGSPAPLYVIGTEVPIPGGEVLDAQAPETTRPEDVARTIQLVRRAFEARGLQPGWERVIALVVQPGVEFGDATVFPYMPEKARALSRFVDQHREDRQWQGVYEAHSTDYQTPAALRQMVHDHFAILKVGPWLTFAFREAVFALAAAEKEWLSDRKGITISRVRESLDEAMLANPEHWKNYYRGDEAALRLARKYSFSDRSRYYWTQPNVAAALQRLLANLTDHPAPVSLLSQYLPDQSEALLAGAVPNNPVALIHNKILGVIQYYAQACAMSARQS